MVLANGISKNMEDFSKEEIIKNIERVHRVTTGNRNPSATRYRGDLKEQDPSIQGYVKFPAILMIKCTRERNCSLEKEFCTRILSFELQIF